jgi:CheY-like chemotaxis protein
MVSAPTPAMRRGAILVVEDRDDVRDGMAQLLELHGFVVVDAADAEQAWGHLNADPSGFALILLDLNLPGVLDGTGLRGRQLAYPRLRDIPTVVVSAMLPDDELRSTLHADAWISKPYRFDELLAIVKQHVTPEAGALLND